MNYEALYVLYLSQDEKFSSNPHKVRVGFQHLQKIQYCFQLNVCIITEFIRLKVASMQRPFQKSYWERKLPIPYSHRINVSSLWLTKNIELDVRLNVRELTRSSAVEHDQIL